MSTQQELSTNDLALATYLNMEGFTHARLEMMDRRSACWIFEARPALREEWDDYQAGDALVEPLAFSRKLREIRDELYQFLKANRKR